MLHATATPKFLALEGLRGVLAVLVCIGHLGLNTVAARFGFKIRFELSVDVFFALSSFVLCYSNFFGAKPLRLFLIARVARLYPLYIATTLTMVALGIAKGEVGSWGESAQQILLLNNIGFPPSKLPMNFPSWSIPVELWGSLLFFLALPKLGVSARARAARLCGLVMLVLSSAWLIGGRISEVEQNVWTVLNIGVLRGLAGFATGALAYLVYARALKDFEAPLLLSYGLLASLALFFVTDDWSALKSIAFYGVLAGCLVALATSRCGTVLAAWPLVFLGSGPIKGIPNGTWI